MRQVLDLSSLRVLRGSSVRSILLKASGLVLLLLAVAAGVGRIAKNRSETRFHDFPRVTLWAWERPEDLRALDPKRYAIAYLDQTISISDRAWSTPRFQPLQVASSARLIAVIRIEAPTQTAQVDVSGLTIVVADLIASSAKKPGVAALEVDFDAARSQRQFYSEVLHEVRRLMPEDMPLSITALASWCGRGDWLKDLPVDEAVPMLFRMGLDPHASNRPGWTYPIREPLCSTSVGVSTDETWPRIVPTQRIYVFHPRPWDALAVANVRKLIGP